MPSVTTSVSLGAELSVCRLGCGTGTIASGKQSNQTRMGAKRFEALLQYAYDQGVRLFDVADDYGSHPYVGRVLKGRDRDSFQIVSKITASQETSGGQEHLLAELPVMRSLKELGLEYIDVLQIHCVATAQWNREHQAQMAAMARLKERGLIRAHGVSCHSLAALEVAAEEPWVDVIHARINPYGEAMDAAPDKVVPILERAHHNGKGIIGMKLIGEGVFDAEQRRRTIQWVAGLGCVDVIIVGFERPEEIDEFRNNVRVALRERSGVRNAG